MSNIMQQRQKFAEIPKRFVKANIKQFEDSVVKVCDRFIKAEGWRSLLVVGPIGTGKTHLACGIANEYCSISNALYTTAYKMSQRIMSDGNADHFQKYPMLIIDEVTRSFDSRAEQNRFFDLINHRYENEMPVVIIGNRNDDEIREAVGEPVWDRLSERSMTLALLGESKR